MTFYEPFSEEPFTEPELWDRLADCVYGNFADEGLRSRPRVDQGATAEE